MKDMKKRGVFICIEGLDGCGKTTQSKLLVAGLKTKGYSTLLTAEPSNSKIGLFLKEYCLHGKDRVSSIIETLLFAADRFEHLQKEVVPALREGKIVISDRYVYSSLAYQGATGLDLEWIEKVNEHARCPDLAIFVDVALETAMQRLKAKKSVMEKLDNLSKVREIYMNFVRKKKLVKVDGNMSEEEVANEIFKAVHGFLEGS
jgi:dTMP kinase